MLGHSSKCRIAKQLTRRKLAKCEGKYSPPNMLEQTIESWFNKIGIGHNQYRQDYQFDFAFFLNEII